MEIQTFINILRLGVPALSALIIIGCDQNQLWAILRHPQLRRPRLRCQPTPPPAKSFTTNITEWQGVQTGMAPAEFARAVGVIDQGGVVEHPKKEYLMHYDPTGKTIDDIELIRKGDGCL